MLPDHNKLQKVAQLKKNRPISSLKTTYHHNQCWGPYRKRDQAFTGYLLVANAPLTLSVTTTILIMTALITLLIMTIF